MKIVAFENLFQTPKNSYNDRELYILKIANGSKRTVSFRSGSISRGFPSLDLDTVVEERSDPEQTQVGIERIFLNKKSDKLIYRLTFLSPPILQIMKKCFSMTANNHVVLPSALIIIQIVNFRA